MNILMIHSANYLLVKQVINKFRPQHNVYVLMFSRSKGLFIDCAEEIYFSHNDVRMRSYAVLSEVQNIINQYAIDKVIGVYNNDDGGNYENLRVLLSLLHCPVKMIYDKNLDCRKDMPSRSDIIVEKYYYQFGHESMNNHQKLAEIIQDIRNKKIRQVTKVRKILFVNTSYTIGGVETLLYKWGLQLANSFKIVFACDTNGDMYEDYLNGPFISYVNRPNAFQDQCHLDFYFFIKKIIHKEKPDAIIIAGLDTTMPATLAAIRCGVPIIVKMVNGKTPEIANCTSIKCQLNTFAGLYDKVIAVSDFVKNDLADFGINREKIHVIYGSTVQVGNSVPFKGNEPNTKNFLCISRLTSEKGVDVLLQAITRLQSSVLDKTHFLIAGDGKERANLEKLSCELGIDSYVSFLGFRKDIYELIHQSYATILSSHTEGLPVCVLETMALGKICIASDVGGTAEIISHGNNGLLFEDNDIDKLAEHIAYCVLNPVRVCEMEKNSVKTIGEKFSVEVVTHEFNMLLQSLAEEKLLRR